MRYLVWVLLCLPWVGGAEALPGVALTVRTVACGEARAAALEKDVLLSFSDGFQHVCWDERDASGVVRVVDGVRGKPYTVITGGAATGDGSHSAFLCVNEIKDGNSTTNAWFLVIDGKEYALAPDQVTANMICLAPDRQRLLYPRLQHFKLVMYYGEKAGPEFDYIKQPTISPDSAHFAYYARSGNAWFAVKDHVERFPLQDAPLGIHALVFSPDSRRFAYSERLGEGKTRNVVDGQPTPAYPMVTPVTFSADSARYCYVALTGLRSNARLVVADGVPGPEYDTLAQSPVFSPVGHRLLYVAVKDGRSFVVLDGVAEPAYDSVGPVMISPDGQRVLYAAREKRQAALVVDGAIGAWADYVYYPLFSPDSRHVAYQANRDGAVRLVVDGVAQETAYQAMGPQVFSPDSRRVAFCGKRDGQWRVVCDGTDGPTLDAMSYIHTFSPDSAHLAYRARIGGKMAVVCDGKVGELYDAVGDPRFSRDSRRVGYLACRDGAWRPVINGVAGPVIPGEVINGTVSWANPANSVRLSGFDDAGTFIYVMKQPGSTAEQVRFVRVEVASK